LADTVDHMPRPLPLLFALVLLSSCAATIPVVPPGARGQQPRGGGPDCAWIARAGRLDVIAGSQRISAKAQVKRQADGQIRLGIISDDGELLADLIAQAGTIERVQLQPVLEPFATALGHALAQTWAAPRDKAQWVDGWIVGRTGDSERYYGGDPLVLRRVSGEGTELTIEDYRWETFGLLAHEVRGQGPFGSFRLSLGAVGQPAAPLPIPGTAVPLPASGERW
jgi:hypothetical protein